MDRLLRCCLASLLILLGGAVLSSSLWAQVPSVISYQGTLGGDDPIPERVSLRFAFYASDDGGTPLGDWTEMHTDVPVNAGRFSVLIGSINPDPLPLALFDTETVYLDVEIDDEPLSRLRLASTPFALRAARADSAEVADRVVSDAIDTDALADEAVVRANIAPGAVTTDALASGSVTGNELADGTTVRSLNGATDDVRLVGGDNVTIERDESELTITAVGAASSTVATQAPLAGDGTEEDPIQLPNGTLTAEKFNTRAEPDNGDYLRYLRGQLTWDDEDGFFDASQPSSRRWKTDIRDLGGALALIEQLRGVRFTWEEDGRSDIGLIAEEVGEVVPEVVTYEENGTEARGVNYARLVAVLVEAIKVQQRDLENTKQQMARLEERVARLERALPQLKNAATPSSAERSGR